MNNSFNDNKDLNSNEVSYTMIKVIILSFFSNILPTKSNYFLY